MKLSGKKIWLIGIIICSLVSVSLAYVLWGYQWPVGSNVAFYINANTAQVPDELSAVNAAADTWNAIYPAGLTMTYSGTTSVTTHGNDGSNNVYWDDEGATGTLATAWAWVAGSTFIDTDMVFNDFYNWSTSGATYDIETVALHEFGHWVGLDHSASGIMTPSYSGEQRSVDSDARDGFEAMYGSAPAGPSIELDKTSLSFLGDGTDSFNVRNSGEDVLNYQLDSNRSWLGVLPGSESSSGEWDEFQVSTDTSGLDVGDYSGTISVTSAGASNSPQYLSVYLTIPDDLPPTISITSPSNNTVVTSTVTIKASASDDKGVEKVDFFVDNEFKMSVFSPPYEWEWNPSAYSSGFHTVMARAYDTIDQTAEASVNLKIDKPPEVTLTSPASGTDISGTVILEASATDDFGISNVRFYINSVLKKTDSAVPYDYVWETSLFQNGNYEVKAEVLDIVNQTDQHTITNYVLPHPPENFSAVKKDNSSVLLEEFINVLTWQALGLNREISKYKIYQVVDGNMTFLSEVSGDTFIYWHRDVEKDKLYSYMLTAVDANGKEGEEASVDVQ